MAKKTKVSKSPISLAIPEQWKDDLERKARVRAYEEDRNITCSDLIREAIASYFGYVDEENKKEIELK